jgi:hypothetical protein
VSYRGSSFGGSSFYLLLVQQEFPLPLLLVFGGSYKLSSYNSLKRMCLSQTCLTRMLSRTKVEENMDEFLKDKLRALLASAASKIDRESFSQEPHFTSAFFGKLHKEQVSNGAGQFIRLMFSASNDRGPNSAEHNTGIDVGLVFQWVIPGEENFEKAVLLQAKNHLMNLDAKDQSDLSAQCKKMSQMTSSYLVMDCPYDNTIPTVCESQSGPPYWTPPPISLADYIVDYVLECKRGDVDTSVIQRARRADRRLVIQTNSPKPKLQPKAKPIIRKIPK